MIEYLTSTLVGCQRTPCAPRCGDKRHFHTMCRKLGWRADTVPRTVAGYIRREIRRAISESRPPSANSVRLRLLNSRYRRWV